MARHFSNRNRATDGLHPSRRLTQRELQKILRTKVRKPKLTPQPETLAKRHGLVLERKAVPNDYWIIRDARTGTQILEYDSRSGKCQSSLDGKSSRIRKWDICGAIDFAHQSLVRSKRKDIASRRASQSRQAESAGMRLVAISMDQCRLEAHTTNEVLCVCDQMINTCNVPGLLNPQVQVSSFDEALRLADERCRLPQVTGKSVVSVLNRTLKTRHKYALLEMGTEHLGRIELISVADPLGAKLLKKRQGDIFAVDFDDGTEEFEILHVAEP